MSGRSGAKGTLLAFIFAWGILYSGLEPVFAQQRPSPPPEVASPPAGGDEGKNPRIAPGDVVSITVYPAEEYNRETTVQPDGRLELSLLGSIMVKGLTVTELARLLESKYSRYVDNPKVTVATRHFAGRRVAIIGEIKAPGFYEYRDGMKALELVSLAGGLLDNAKASRMTVLRDGAAAGTRFNFQSVLDGRLDRDLALMPGDTIYVPKTTLNKKSTWLTNNILPWLSFAGLAASLALLAKQ